MIKFSKEKDSDKQLPFFEVVLSDGDDVVRLYIPCNAERIFQVLIDALKSGLCVTIDNYVYENIIDNND